MMEFVVAVSAQSITDMNAERYYELHIKAASKELALQKAKEHVSGWYIHSAHFDVLPPNRQTAVKGSMCYVEVP